MVVDAGMRVVDSPSESIPGAPQIVPGSSPPRRRRTKSQQDVLSTWSTLPVGARGFHIRVPFGVALATQPAFALWRVPPGYVAVLEGYRYDANDICTVSVVLGGAVDPYQSEVDVAQFRDSETRVWGLADENTDVGLMLVGAGNNDGAGPTGSVWIRGTLLDRVGDALAFEVAGRIPALPEEIAAQIIRHQRAAREQDARRMGGK